MEYKILSAGTAGELSHKVREHVNRIAPWKAVGSHQVVETHRQNRFRGDQHTDTVISVEYSQTMVRGK